MKLFDAFLRSSYTGLPRAFFLMKKNSQPLHAVARILSSAIFHLVCLVSQQDHILSAELARGRLSNRIVTENSGKAKKKF